MNRFRNLMRACFCAFALFAGARLGCSPCTESAPGARLVRPRISQLGYAPLNGRAFAYVFSLLSKSACARVFRACARRFESVRRNLTFANASSILFEVLLQVKRPV